MGKRKNKNRKRGHAKITNQLLTLEFIDARAAHFKKWEVPKWLGFAKHFIEKGYDVELYEARETFSKYLTVIKAQRRFKVRFSNHKPILARELAGDCDYFVGVTNTGVRTTEHAIFATEIYMENVDA